MESLPGCLHILLEDANASDISILVEKRMGVLDAKLKEKATLSDVERIEILGSAVKVLTDNARGVFLWVELVTQDLLKCIEKGYRRIKFLNSLDNIPKDLMPFYERIVRELVEAREECDREEYIEETRRIFTWITFAASPLRIEVLGEAIIIPDLPDLTRKFIKEYRYGGGEAIRLQLATNCGNLLEIKQTTATLGGLTDSTVQLLHQTVRDFLLLKDKSASPFNMSRAVDHKLILSSCAQYLRIALNDNE